jgi:hypothetical protein
MCEAQTIAPQAHIRFEEIDGGFESSLYEGCTVAVPMGNAQGNRFSHELRSAA